MAERKLFGVLSGAQLTIIGALAIVAPGAVYAVTYTSAGVTDPVTGKLSAVDAGSRLAVYDPIAGYEKNPANLLQISGAYVSNGLTPTNVYKVPTGKALILTSVTFAHTDYPNKENHGLLFQTNCNLFSTYGGFIAGYNDAVPDGAYYSDLGSGYFLRSGDCIVLDTGTAANVFLEGYFVPEAAVPPVSSNGAAQQAVFIGRFDRK